MGAAKPLEKEITQYLSLLTERQKEAVLKVVKTFAEETEEYDYLNDDSFASELDKRRKEYETGKAKVLTLEQLETGVRKAYKAKSKDKK